MKIKAFIYRNYKIILILLVLIMIDLVYVKYYYKSINGTYLLTNFIITLNYIGAYFQRLADIILKEELLKIVIIGSFIVYSISKFDLVDCIKNFNSIEYKDLKIKKESISTKVKNEKELKNNVETEQKEISNKEIENSEIRLSQKKEIEQLFIDCPFIISIIDSYLNRKIRNITLNLNLIPYKIKLSQIDKLFEYQLRSNSVVIISIKKEIEAIVVDVFKELQEKGIIYTE
ncbi:hypothetical protein FDA09_06710 [Clostridium botulinum]|uniref:hypothetical protein n=1 Tax=Clostridium botulinum TaxID=1491 RepID=UPI00077314A4|nr:hypothetical protein [Clostridium botulinum]NFH79092.1 hypothetical protein [Clostridium botulinum]NFH82658.1 hypothetical protein [Clostridium botulinum]NFI11083.1 hypothetical protein [Clostridium botulinum]NFI13907.1 hypothetical protein [Clostridium botulinum]NFO83356.1 hypothetical protein [Clostridium botulinum]